MTGCSLNQQLPFLNAPLINLKTINVLLHIHLLYNKQPSNFMSMLCSRFEHWKSDWKTWLCKRTRSEDHNKGFTPSFRACHILFGPLLPATFPLGVFPTYGLTHAYVIVSAWTTEGECVKIHTVYLPFPVFGSIFLCPVKLRTAGKWSQGCLLKLFWKAPTCKL